MAFMYNSPYSEQQVDLLTTTACIGMIGWLDMH